MAVERVFAVEVSVLVHDAVSLPNEYDIRKTVRDALGKEYPNVSMCVSVQSKDNELRKEKK